MVNKKDNDTVEKTLVELGITDQRDISINPSVSINPEITQREYEYYLHCKHQIELLIASGKCKEFTGKSITFQELDAMPQDKIVKLYKVYEESRLARINDSISDGIIKCYSKLCNHVLPIENETKLYNDLKNDYLVMTELQKWVGYLSYQLGGVMTLISTGVITFSNTKKLDNINGRGERRENRSEECQETKITETDRVEQKIGSKIC